MARNDGIDRTVARNRDLKKSDTIKGAQAHNERQKEIYSNPDIVPERTPFNVHFKEPTGSLPCSAIGPRMSSMSSRV